MATSSIFLVTHDDGDFYTRHPDTLAAFRSRDEACAYALCRQAYEIESFGEIVTGLQVREVRGDELVSVVEAVPTLGLRREWPGQQDPEGVADRDAVYRDLERQLYR